MSFRQIAASLKLSIGVISKYTKAAEAAGLSWPFPDGLNDHELEAKLFPSVSSHTRLHLPPPGAQTQRRRPDDTMEEYRDTRQGQAYQYAQFYSFFTSLFYIFFCSSLNIF